MTKKKQPAKTPEAPKPSTLLSFASAHSQLELINQSGIDWSLVRHLAENRGNGNAEAALRQYARIVRGIVCKGE